MTRTSCLGRVPNLARRLGLEVEDAGNSWVWPQLSCGGCSLQWERGSLCQAANHRCYASVGASAQCGQRPQCPGARGKSRGQVGTWDLRLLLIPRLFVDNYLAQ